VSDGGGTQLREQEVDTESAEPPSLAGFRSLIR